MQGRCVSGTIIWGPVTQKIRIKTHRFRTSRHPTVPWEVPEARPRAAFSGLGVVMTPALIKPAIKCMLKEQSQDYIQRETKRAATGQIIQTPFGSLTFVQVMNNRVARSSDTRSSNYPLTFVSIFESYHRLIIEKYI